MVDMFLATVCIQLWDDNDPNIRRLSRPVIFMETNKHAPKHWMGT